MYSTSPHLVSLAVLLSSASLVASQFNYTGGVALRVPDSCPEGTLQGLVTYEINCCPGDQYFPPGNAADYCCPSPTDCRQTVLDGIKCADDSWNYCPSPNNAELGFCCQDGWVCYEELPNGLITGGVACGPPGYVLEAFQTAVPTAIHAFEGVEATTSSSTSSTSSTTTASSTTTTASSTATTSSTSPPAVLSATASPSATSSDPVSSTSNSLAIGLGAGLGVPLVLAILAGLAFLCYRRGKRSARRPVRGMSGVEEPLYREPLTRQEMNVPHTWQELDVQQKRPGVLSEMPSHTYDSRAELDAGGGRGAC
ncbi:hypothetical protein MMC32_005416 [Xylographa parallela]|nr:hypothetical protein [Xylographa parallela]